MNTSEIDKVFEYAHVGNVARVTIKDKNSGKEIFDQEMSVVGKIYGKIPCLHFGSCSIAKADNTWILTSQMHSNYVVTHLEII